MFLQPLPASALREAAPQSGSAVTGSGTDDARKGRFAALLTDTLARSRLLTPHAHEPAESAQQASEPQERWADSETRARTRDHEPELHESSAPEADDPAADEEGSTVPAPAALPHEEGVSPAALPLVPTPPAAPSPEPSPQANVLEGTFAPVAPAAPGAANGTSALAAGAPASSAQDARLTAEAGAAQPSRGPASRSVRASQTGMVAEPATPELAAVGGGAGRGAGAALGAGRCEPSPSPRPPSICMESARISVA